MMTFFPSILLIAISYSTSFFRLPNFFNTAITVNLSVMLTLTNLLISVVKKLAETYQSGGAPPPTAGADDDEDVPDLVDNFEEASK